MPVYTCAVADCTSCSRKKDPEVKGWCVFPRKKDPVRRRLWESRCKRGQKWKATTYYAVCSKHFIDWCKGPSPSHPDPELFGYNQWKAKKGNEDYVGKRSQRRARYLDDLHGCTLSIPVTVSPSSAPEPCFYMDIDQRVQADVYVRTDNVNQKPPLVIGMLSIGLWLLYLFFLLQNCHNEKLYFRDKLV